MITDVSILENLFHARLPKGQGNFIFFMVGLYYRINWFFSGAKLLVKLPRLKSWASSPFCKTAEAYPSPD